MYRLLRYVNSPLCGLRHEVTSIQSAILTVGDDLMRRIGTLAVTTELNAGASPEILRMALVRARFCELTILPGSSDATEQYLMGLFSMLPAMLQKPMEEALSGLPLRRLIRDALLGLNKEIHWPLDWLQAHERSEFDRADAISEASGADRELLAETFAQAT